jgi:hypothetical protein
VAAPPERDFAANDALGGEQRWIDVREKGGRREGDRHAVLRYVNALDEIRPSPQTLWIRHPRVIAGKGAQRILNHCMSAGADALVEKMRGRTGRGKPLVNSLEDFAGAGARFFAVVLLVMANLRVAPRQARARSAVRRWERRGEARGD